MDRLAASVVEGTDGGFVSRKGVRKDGISMSSRQTPQVAISRRVNRSKLVLRDCQDNRERREENGELNPMASGEACRCGSRSTANDRIPNVTHWR